MYQLGRFVEGEKWYEQALQQCEDEPSRRETLLWVGESRSRAGRIEEAVQAYEQAAELDDCPAGKALTYLEVGAMLWRAGRGKKSVPWLKKSVRTHRLRHNKSWLRRVRLNVLSKEWFG